MAYGDWSTKTQQLLTGTPGTQISFGDVRAAVGDTSASISASEMHRVTDLDAPYDFNTGKYATSSSPHLPYVLDATENVGVSTGGAITPQDLRGIIDEYVISFFMTVFDLRITISLILSYRLNEISFVLVAFFRDKFY